MEQILLHIYYIGAIMLFGYYVFDITDTVDLPLWKRALAVVFWPPLVIVGLYFKYFMDKR